MRAAWFTRFSRKPDVVLGQHVMPLPVGRIAIRSGPVLSRSDSLEVTMFGRGGHGSAPETTVDPVVMAAAAVMRLQTVVSREIAMTDYAVVTVGALQAGSSANRGRARAGLVGRDHNPAREHRSRARKVIRAGHAAEPLCRAA